MGRTDTSIPQTVEPVVAAIGMKLEVVVIPVSDIDRAKEFYAGLGWRFDRDFRFVDGYGPSSSRRPVPPVPCISGRTKAQPETMVLQARPYGFSQGIPDSLRYCGRSECALARGVEVSEFFHVGEGGVSAGLDPERRSYSSRASFDDPDGNSGYFRRSQHGFLDSLTQERLRSAR